jgi:hypothetical protein
MLATPDAPPVQPTMCLLHGDFHVMEQACWSTTLDFQLAHTHLDGQEARDAYLTAVEREMLNNLVESIR